MLTAIVIGFSVLAFAIVLIKRAHQEAETDDFDRMDTRSGRMNPVTLVLMLPVLIPLGAALLTLALRNHCRAQRAASVAGWAGLFAVGGLAPHWSCRRRRAMSLQLGGWPAPFGITLVADLLSAI